MSNFAVMSMKLNESLLFLRRVWVKQMNSHPSCFQKSFGNGGKQPVNAILVERGWKMHCHQSGVFSVL